MTKLFTAREYKKLERIVFKCNFCNATHSMENTEENKEKFNNKIVCHDCGAKVT